jgi:WD40 repeat protein
MAEDSGRSAKLANPNLSDPKTDSSSGRVHPERRSLWRRLADALFGYDYFVCYAWADARPYANDFAAKLEHLGLDCFLDSEDYALSDDWKRVGSWTLRRTGQLLLIGSPAALDRPAVLRETRLFSQTGRRIVAISFAGSLDPTQTTSKLFRYLKAQTLRFEESPERLALGPSEEAITRVVSSFQVVRQRDKRLRLISLTAALLALFAVAAGFAAVIAVSARASAEKRSQINLAQRLAAQSELVRAEFPKRSALLALESLRVAHVAGVGVRDAEEAGRRALSSFYESTPYVHAGLTSMAVSPDGRWLATGGEDTLIRLWDLDNPESEPRALRGHKTTVQKLSFSPDGKWLVSGGAYFGRGLIAERSDDPAFLWNVSDASLPPSPLKGKGVAIGFAFANSSSWLAVLFSDGAVGVWNVGTTPSSASVLLSGPDLDAKTIAVDQRGNWLAIGYRNGTARIWSQATLLRNAKPVILAGHDDPVVRTLTFSPDGRWLVTTSTDTASDSGAPPTTSRTARLWDLQALSPETRAIQLEIRSTFHRVWEVEFSSDSKWLMMRAETPDLRVWRMPEHGAQAGGFTLRDRSVDDLDELTAATFSDDGRYIAAGSRRGALQIWRMELGAPVEWRALSNASTEVTSLSFSPNNTALFAGGRDGWVRVWSLDSVGRLPVETAAGHEGEVSDLRIVRGGRDLLTVSYSNKTVGGAGDESVRRFHLDSSQLPVRTSTILRIPSDGYSVQQSQDRHWIAFASGSMQTTLINATTSGSVSRYSVVPGALDPRAFSSSGAWLATRAESGVVLTNLRNSRQVIVSAASSNENLKVVYTEFSADDSRLMVAEEHTAKLYDLRTPTEPTLIATVHAPGEFRFTAPNTYVSSRGENIASSVAMSRDGRWLLATWRKYLTDGGSKVPRGIATLWDLRDGPNHAKEYSLNISIPHTGVILNDKIVVSTPDGTAYVWRLPYSPDQRAVILKGGGRPHPVDQNTYASGKRQWVLTLSADTAFREISVSVRKL